MTGQHESTAVTAARAELATAEDVFAVAIRQHDAAVQERREAQERLDAAEEEWERSHAVVSRLYRELRDVLAEERAAAVDRAEEEAPLWPYVGVHRG